MTEKLDITIENKLIKEKRDINVFHQSTRSAHIISRNSSITLPLRSVEEDDYLHISIVSGPGNLWKNCMIELPSITDFEFAFEGKAMITHSNNRTLLKIPPGSPTWQLKITIPNNPEIIQTSAHVIIGDERSD